MKTCKMYESFLEKKKNTMNLQLGQLKFRNILFMIRDHLTLKSRTISKVYLLHALRLTWKRLHSGNLRAMQPPFVQPSSYATALYTTKDLRVLIARETQLAMY